jgi:tetratricopeptide (TPR) repeat protein
VITGELESASRLLASADRTPYPHDRIAQATGHNILAEASGDLERALDGYREAADRWRAFGNVFEEAQALLGAGRCLIGIGSGEEAAPLLRSAEAIFGRLGAKPLLEETLSQLGQATALSL